MYKAILFDLDGTLTDSGEGITKSVQYALEKVGKPEPDLQKLRIFVGPPLLEQFQEYAGIDEETARKAVEIYRERYAPVGIYENELYPGIPEMLSGLKQRGYKLAIASSKPENFVKIVAEYFHIDSYFDEMVGSEPEGRRTNKTEVIEDPVTVAREAATFSVTVPTTLPISVDANGNVTTATDAAIINNSGAPVAVTKVELASLSDWTLAAYSRDILNLSVDAKQFGLQMNIGDKTIATSNSGTSDILSDSLNARIAKGQNCAVNYNALFPAQTAAVSDTKIANVVFTVGWA